MLRDFHSILLKHIFKNCFALVSLPSGHPMCHNTQTEQYKSKKKKIKQLV